MTARVLDSPASRSTQRLATAARCWRPATCRIPRRSLGPELPDVARRGSHQEALTALESLGETGPVTRDHLRALGRHATAAYPDARPGPARERLD